MDAYNISSIFQSHPHLGTMIMIRNW